MSTVWRINKVFQILPEVSASTRDEMKSHLLTKESVHCLRTLVAGQTCFNHLRLLDIVAESALDRLIIPPGLSIFRT